MRRILFGTAFSVSLARAVVIRAMKVVLTCVKLNQTQNR